MDSFKIEIAGLEKVVTMNKAFLIAFFALIAAKFQNLPAPYSAIPINYQTELSEEEEESVVREFLTSGDSTIQKTLFNIATISKHERNRRENLANLSEAENARNALLLQKRLIEEEREFFKKVQKILQSQEIHSNLSKKKQGLLNKYIKTQSTLLFTEEFNLQKVKQTISKLEAEVKDKQDQHNHNQTLINDSINQLNKDDLVTLLSKMHEEKKYANLKNALEKNLEKAKTLEAMRKWQGSYLDKQDKQEAKQYKTRQPKQIQVSKKESKQESKSFFQPIKDKYQKWQADREFWSKINDRLNPPSEMKKKFFNKVSSIIQKTSRQIGSSINKAESWVETKAERAKKRFNNIERIQKIKALIARHPKAIKRLIVTAKVIKVAGSLTFSILFPISAPIALPLGVLPTIQNIKNVFVSMLVELTPINDLARMFQNSAIELVKKMGGNDDPAADNAEYANDECSTEGSSGQSCNLNQNRDCLGNQCSPSADDFTMREFEYIDANGQARTVELPTIINPETHQYAVRRCDLNRMGITNLSKLTIKRP